MYERKAFWTLTALILVLALAAGTAFAGGQQDASKQKGAGAASAEAEIVIAQQNWSGSIATAAIFEYVLESKLHIPVSVKDLQQAMTWPAVAKGTVDVYADIWLPAQDAGYQKYVVEEKTVESTLSYDNAPQGIYIPTWVAKEYGINDIFDLSKNSKIFDLTGDGKGDFWAGGFGWSVTEINTVKIKSYPLDFDPYVVEQWVFLTTLVEAMRQKKPIAFYYWEPEWVFAQYDLTLVKEPAYEEAKYKYIPKDMENSNIVCAMPFATVRVGYSANLKVKSPRAYQFFKNWQIPMKEVSFLIAEIEDVPNNPKKEPAEVAKAWVEKHPELVNAWIKGIE